MLFSDVRMGVRPAWLVGPSAHRSCVWLDHVRFAAGAPLHALSPKIPHFTYQGDSSALPGSLLAVVMEHGRERHLLQAYHHGAPNITLEARVCECGAAHIYVLAVQVVRPGDPLICASRAWRWTALVAHFDGASLRGMTTRSLPKRPTPFPTARTPTTPRVLQVHTRSRPLPALVTVLHQAQLIAATELPRISWRYVPREANKEASPLGSRPPRGRVLGLMGVR